ncbi:MAG: YrhA family protein [Nibricoccus sp.]
MKNSSRNVSNVTTNSSPRTTQADIAKMVSEAKAKLDYSVDNDYLQFLKRFDGLDHNGYSVYATKISLITGYSDCYVTGFVERNLQYWQVESNRQFIAFGESGDERFVFDKDAGKFAELDQSSASLIRFHDSFDSLLARLLELALGNFKG